MAYISEDGNRFVGTTEDSAGGRRSRASAIAAVRRTYERERGVKLTLIHKSYSETYGFLHRSTFRYKIAEGNS